ncbi:hypothetical protein [Leeuwenhoekiella sp. LLG6367-2.1]|uniref:hypothetical protein n=1 Tax=Leeuwenhoekiella sp. LLG6367-2.1 TaxID=3160833 RepID=UPI003863B2E7
MSNEKIVTQVLSDKPDTKEIIIRTGDAEKILHAGPLTINGNIDAPARFLEVRSDVTDRLESHCLVSKSDGTIKLINNEGWENDRQTITGKIETGKLYKDLGINDSSKSYGPKELSKRFKLLRAIFPERADHANVVATLNNFQAKVNSELKDTDDRRGNKTLEFQQAVESNVPNAFTINIPLVEGENPTPILVDIIIEASSSLDVRCFLESADAAENIDKVREERVMQEVEKLQEFTTVIFI